MWNNVDENLLFQKEWILKRTQDFHPDDIDELSHNISINEVEDLSRNEDKFTYKNLFNEKENEFTKHRVLDFYKTINGKTYHFKISHSLVENEDILKAIVTIQGCVFLVLIIALTLINRHVERKVWQPFYRVLLALKNYRIDHQNFPKPEQSSILEMNSLNYSLVDLTEKNQKLFLSQKEFIENASHELQTPLAVIQNKLEMLLQTENFTQEQIGYIEDIYNSNQRLSKLNKSLLLLAKIENHQFKVTQEIEIKKIIQKVLTDTSFLIEEKNIQLHQDFSTSKIVFGNEILLQILMSNLISNAIKYAENNGNIFINLNENYFDISNSSSHSKLEENQLFKRFQKQNSAQESTGLGLEISKKIAENYQWTLVYNYNSRLHSFKLNF